MALAIALPVVYSVLWIEPSIDKWLGNEDGRTYYVPSTFYLDASLHSGELPLWNPLIFCGMPYAASPQTAAFYPFHLLRGILEPGRSPLSSLISLRLEALFHLILAFFGMYCLARDHRLTRAASLLAAFVFAFSDPFVIAGLGAWVFLASGIWLPYLLIALRRAMRAESFGAKLPHVLAMGLFSGLSLLGGFPQIALVTFACVVCYAALFSLTQARPPYARWFLMRGMDCSGFVLVFAVAALLALPLLLPAAELNALSQRTPNSPGSVIASSVLFILPYYLRAGVVVLALAAWSHPRKRDVFLCVFLFLFCADYFLGPPSPVNTLLDWLAPFKLGATHRTASAMAVPLGLLAGLGFDAMREGRSRSLAGTVFRAAVAVGLVVLYRLWPFQHTPASIVFDILPLVAMAVVALPIADWRLQIADCRIPEHKRFSTMVLSTIRNWRRLAVFVVVVAEILLYERYMMTWRFANAKSTYSPASIRAEKTMSTENRRDAVWPPNHLLMDLKPAITGYEDAYIKSVHDFLVPRGSEDQYSRVVSPEYVGASMHRGNLLLKRRLWLARECVRRPALDKKVIFAPTQYAFLEGPADEWSRRAVPDWAKSIPVDSEPAGPLPRAEKTRRMTYSLMFPRWDSQRARGVCLPGEEMDLSSYLLPEVPQTDEGYGFGVGPFRPPKRHSVLRLTCRVEKDAWVESFMTDPSAGRWAYGTSYMIYYKAGAEQTIEIPLPDFDLLSIQFHVRTWQLEGQIVFTGAKLVPDLADEDELIRIVSSRANSLEAEVGPLPGPRILTYLDAEYPGWQACVDGRRVPLYKAFDVFKAVVVPPGTHRVSFEFRPWRVYAGMAAALPTAALIVLAFLWRWRALAGLRIAKLGIQDPKSKL